MTTRLVVVIRDAGNLGGQEAQTCRVRAHGEPCRLRIHRHRGWTAALAQLHARHFRPAVARARLPKQLRFHDLRRTCVALLTANGRGTRIVKEHKDSRRRIDLAVAA
jgi:hypothetical protein